MFKLGTTSISDIKLGTSQVSKVYLGSSLVWQKQVPLPYDAEVEYLESTGTQWIDTGVYGADNRGTEIDFALTSIQSEKGIFGCLGLPRQCIILAGDRLRYDLGPGSSYRYPQTTARRVVSYNPSSHAVTDSVYGVVGWDDYYQTEFSETPDTMTIFVDKRDGAIVSASRITSMRLYGFKVWDSSGDLLDLIPVRFTNELGQSEGAMYDRVSGALFRNAGTGAFLYGRDINPISARSYVNDGLVAMWDGIENAGWGVHDPNATVWKDLIGNVDLTLHGGCSWADKSLTFNGSTGYADADTSQGAWANVATLDCCLHFDAQPSQCFVVCTSFEDGNLAILLNGYRLCGFVNPTFRRVPNATVVPVLNHVARTKVSGGSSPWYVDGQSVTSDNGNYWNANGSARTVFGASSDGQSGFFKGTIRRVCAYSRALTAAEIAANYAIDKARFNLP